VSVLKVGARCGYCLIHRGYKIILRSTDDKVKQVEAMTELLSMMGEDFNPDVVPSYIGAERDRIIKRVTGCPDAYEGMKREANQKALELLPELRSMLDEVPEAERLRRACLISCLGNVIEYDVPGHSSDIDEALKLLDEGFCIDDTDRLKSLLVDDPHVLLLTDNAGEIAFDRLVVQELHRLGCMVTIAVKGGPSLNDALMEDAVAVGMTGEADEVITTGSDCIGVQLDISSDEFREVFYSVDVIIAKGMANWETLTEVPAPTPLMYLLRTKCEPVADAVGAPLNSSIAMLVPEGWHLT
jgi:uncharacterized protein with ATP-grasp and redox domains